MKKEYVKPTLLVLATEPSQIMATSPGEDVNAGANIPGQGDQPITDDTEDPDAPDENLSKGGLWDEYTW